MQYKAIMNKIFCFGELLLRLSPELGGAWIEKKLMPVYVGGAELNVARALALWDVPVSYGTALPDNYLSGEILRFVEGLGIDTAAVTLWGNRIGTYYLPQGADLKAAGVIYDRVFSSFYELKPGQLDWDKMLDGKSWFHFSAISPALNENVAAVCREGLAAASQKGLTISVDLNYRAKLWQWGKEPVDVMPGLVQHCHLVMGNLWAAEKMLGIKMPGNLEDSREAYLLQAGKTSQAICRTFEKARQVANTFRFDRDDGLKYYATFFQDNRLYVSKERRSKNIVEKVGSGDCFMAGLIYGNHKQLPAQELINFAAAAAFNKLFIKGDATTSSVADIYHGSSVDT